MESVAICIVRVPYVSLWNKSLQQKTRSNTMGFLQVVIVACSHKIQTQRIALYEMCMQRCWWVWANIGIRSRLSDLKAKRLNSEKQERRILAVPGVCFILSSSHYTHTHTLTHSLPRRRLNLVLKQTTGAFHGEVRHQQQTHKREKMKYKNFYKKNEYISWSPFISHFHLCFMFAPVGCVFVCFRWFFFISVSFFVATKLKSKHEVGYAVDLSWLRARDNKHDRPNIIGSLLALEKS